MAYHLDNDIGENGPGGKYIGDGRLDNKLIQAAKGRLNALEYLQALEEARGIVKGSSPSLASPQSQFSMIKRNSNLGNSFGPPLELSIQ